MIKKLLFTFYFLFSTQNIFADTLNILFEERPPYVTKTHDSLKGLVATPLLDALKKTDIKFVLKEKPSKRHLHEIKINKTAVCAIGWFKNPQRESYAKFTKAIYQDQPMGIIARVDNKKIPSKPTIDNLFKDNGVRILGKTSYSYGTFIDTKLQQYKVKRFNVNSDNFKMLTLIGKKRADLMFISFEEATQVLEKHPLKQELRFVKLQNMPSGNKRYLICSQKTSNEIISMINKNLK